MCQTPQSQPSARQLRSQCNVCGGRRLSYAFSQHSHRVTRCEDCELMFLNPQPGDEELAEIRNRESLHIPATAEGRRSASEFKRANAREYLAELARYNGAPSGRLLEVGCGDGDFLCEAEIAGYEVLGIELSAARCATANENLKRGRVEQGELADAKLPDSHFDVCVLNDRIEHVRDPIAFLREVRRVLRPDGAIFISTPRIDFPGSATKDGSLHNGRLTYFNKDNIQTALLNAGFHNVVVQPGWKIRGVNHKKPGITDRVRLPALGVLGKILPASTEKGSRRVSASGLMAFARKAGDLRPRLSVVVPAFNEASTLRPMMDALIAKEIAGMDIEIIVVESNSTDGTRELVQQYSEHPRVKLIFEEKPSGKGHAVRAGLAAATGTYVLIQDADLEYDLEDYESLMEPLVNGRHAFVLGSRHGGRNLWKMRQFTGQRGLSTFLNFGHWLFTTLINVLFWKRLRDPFTMFKVFRRDCLHGLRFTCNRFDFDFELLVRLMQKGYTPVEIPVNYRSRSFHEGKKVSMWRDPLTWLAALARLRFSKVDPMAEVERTRAEDAALQPVRAAQPVQGALAHL